jgi:hypothetical protein
MDEVHICASSNLSPAQCKWTVALDVPKMKARGNVLQRLKSLGEKETADLSTPLRSGRDDNVVRGENSAFPGRVPRTADPSASLGMTKGRVTILWKAVAEKDTIFDMTTFLSFVIPSEAEGSAVLGTLPGNVF